MMTRKRKMICSALAAAVALPLMVFWLFPREVGPQTERATPTEAASGPESNERTEPAQASASEPSSPPASKRFADFLSAVREEGSLPAGWEREAAERLSARRATLKALIASDPERALDMALDDADRALFPESMRRKYLETPVSGTGDLMLAIACTGYHGDAPHPESEMWREAYIGRNRYTAHVYGAKKRTQSMENIPLRGIAIDDQMAVRESPLEVVEPGDRDGAPLLARLGETEMRFPNRTAFEAFERKVLMAELHSEGPVVTYPRFTLETQ